MTSVIINSIIGLLWFSKEQQQQQQQQHKNKPWLNVTEYRTRSRPRCKNTRSGYGDRRWLSFQRRQTRWICTERYFKNDMRRSGTVIIYSIWSRRAQPRALIEAWLSWSKELASLCHHTKSGVTRRTLGHCGSQESWKSCLWLKAEEIILCPLPS